MGVYTFVCRSSGAEWSAKQLSGDLEALASSTYELQRKLVQAALVADSFDVVTSSFSMVSPCSAVFQVIIGGGGGGAFVGGAAAGAAAAGSTAGGAAAAGSTAGGAAAAGSTAGGAAPSAPPAEEEEEVESCDEDLGFLLFD